MPLQHANIVDINIAGDNGPIGNKNDIRSLNMCIRGHMLVEEKTYSVNCHMVIVNIFSKLSPGYCNTFCQLPHILYIVTWLLYPFSVHCHIVIVTIFCTLSHGYYYHILSIVTWLLSSKYVHCHMFLLLLVEWRTSNSGHVHTFR